MARRPARSNQLLWLSYRKPGSANGDSRSGQADRQLAWMGLYPPSTICQRSNSTDWLLLRPDPSMNDPVLDAIVGIFGAILIYVVALSIIRLRRK
jgi:hypothetical protein